MSGLTRFSHRGSSRPMQISFRVRSGSPAKGVSGRKYHTDLPGRGEVVKPFGLFKTEGTEKNERAKVRCIPPLQSVPAVHVPQSTIRVIFRGEYMLRIHLLRSRTRGLAGTCRGASRGFWLRLKRLQRSRKFPRQTLSLACTHLRRDISEPVRVCER